MKFKYYGCRSSSYVHELGASLGLYQSKRPGWYLCLNIYLIWWWIEISLEKP